MLVKGVGGSQLALFIPTNSSEQHTHFQVLRNKIISVFGGVTVVPAKGYWVPPKGVCLQEAAKVLVVVSEEPDALLTLSELAQEYSRDSGEEQVLITRNNVDIVYINKE